MFLAVARQFLFLICLQFFSMHIHADQEEQRFYVGKVTNNPAKQYQNLTPLADYLADALGYSQGRAVFSRNVDDMLNLFSESRVDLFTGSAWEAAMIIESGYGEALAIKHKEGQSGYKSLIVVRADSNIRGINDLAGKLIAFEDPNSTSAYRIPAMMIQQRGLAMIEDLERPLNSKALHYRFSGAEQNSSALLYREVVDAIALSDRDWQMADNVPEFQKEMFRVIYESPVIPRAVEVIRKDLPSETKVKLAGLFKDKILVTQAPEIMLAYHETTGFSEIDPQTLELLKTLTDYYKK